MARAHELRARLRALRRIAALRLLLTNAQQHIRRVIVGTPPRHRLRLRHDLQSEVRLSISRLGKWYTPALKDA